MQPITDDELLKQYSLEDFKQASTFGALSSEAIEWLLSRGRVGKLEKGETLFEPQQRGDSFFVILDGAIGYYKPDDGQYAYIRDYRKGQQIGFVSTIALHDRVGMALATARTVVLEVDFRLFYRMHKEMSADFGLLMLNLSREMARTIREMDDIIVDMKAQKRTTGEDSGQGR